MRLRRAVSRLVAPIKDEDRIPLWVRYLVWFLEVLLYDWRWARNRMVQLLENRECLE